MKRLMLLLSPFLINYGCGATQATVRNLVGYEATPGKDRPHGGLGASITWYDEVRTQCDFRLRGAGDAGGMEKGVFCNLEFKVFDAKEK